MKHFSFLNWSDSYLKACESFGVNPQTGLESFIICLSPLFYFTSSTDSCTNLAMRIFEIFEKTTPKYELDKVTKGTHINHINKLQEFIVSDCSHDLDDYLKIIDVWYDDVKSMLPALQIHTSNSLIIDISKDCSLLCDFMGCSPVEVLQYYVDHVDCESVDSQKLLVTEFFIRKFTVANRYQ